MPQCHSSPNQKVLSQKAEAHRAYLGLAHQDKEKAEEADADDDENEKEDKDRSK
ncbi:hypothetical protein ABBQ32_007065 [Trebouxia sp. C0010 RCD-2024]